MPDYTIRFVPTIHSPASARRFDHGHPEHTLQNAKRQAQLYLDTYPERRQIAQILKTELVFTVDTWDNR